MDETKNEILHLKGSFLHLNCPVFTLDKPKFSGFTYKNHIETVETHELFMRPFRERNGTSQMMNFESRLNPEGDRNVREMMHFIRAVIHDLIRRFFAENWEKDVFLDYYRCHTGYMENGLQLMTVKKG